MVALAALIVGFAVLGLSCTLMLAVSSVEAPATAHLSSEDILNLAQVDDGATLIALDVEGIRERVGQNPWVESVEVERQPSGHVVITVTEHRPYAIVVMGNQDLAWYISRKGVWLEPCELRSQSSESILEQALQVASSEGLFVIADLPASVNPKAGSATEDPTIQGVLLYQESLEDDLASQVAYYRASSPSAIFCVLRSGLEISLGDADDIESKETVIAALMAEHPHKLTYINVRIPSKPTYRLVGIDSVQQGSGMDGEEFDEDAQRRSQEFKDSMAADAAEQQAEEEWDAQYDESWE